MRRYVYGALALVGVVLTAWAVGYAYECRGYWAVGGEYAFLLLPLLLGLIVDCALQDAAEEREARRARWGR